MNYGFCCLLAVVGLSMRCAVAGSPIAEDLSEKLIPWGSSFRSVCNEIIVADEAADAAWRRLKTRKEYDDYRFAIQKHFVAAFGGFPEKCELRPVTTGVVERDGYRVEKIYFQSMPGVFVTANLYLPDERRFKPPYPAYLVSCGHSQLGKGNEGYGRACVMGALQGFAALIYDPISQGERIQVPDTANCSGHNRFGSLAALLGRSMGQLRIWDGMRAMDYLDARSDVRHDGYGVMGNSGGGTLTSLMMAIDHRVKAAAPSCYLTSLRDVCQTIGPQDAEQNTFGQLSFGLNHASLVLMGGNAIRMHCCHSDMFPMGGALSTFAVVQETARNCGLPLERYGMTDVPGYHGWKESLRLSSLTWMRRWLLDEKEAQIDVMACRFADAGFDLKSVDTGLGPKGHEVVKGGDVRSLPGFRSIYDLLRDDLMAAERCRDKKKCLAPLSAVRKRAGIRSVGEFDVRCHVVSERQRGGLRVRKEIISLNGGYEFPAVTFAPENSRSAPVLLLGDGERKSWTNTVEKLIGEGAPVIVADLVGTGELGNSRFKFYEASNPDENVAVMYYLLGKSLIGVRAEQIIALAKAAFDRFGMRVDIRADGRVSIAAAHAYASERSLFSRIKLTHTPMGWSDAVRKSASIPFANVVHGALLDYDWKDLTK